MSNKATFCSIELPDVKPAPKYTYAGAITLVDGMKGTDSYSNGAWLGFIDGDVTAVIDLGQATNIQRVATDALVDMGSWIAGCTGLTVSVSADNKNFRQVASQDFPADTDFTKKQVENYEVTFEPTEARYVKVVIKRTPALPKGHAGEGKTPYLFIDEIEVE